MSGSLLKTITCLKNTVWRADNQGIKQHWTLKDNSWLTRTPNLLLAFLKLQKTTSQPQDEMRNWLNRLFSTPGMWGGEKKITHIQWEDVLLLPAPSIWAFANYWVTKININKQTNPTNKQQQQQKSHKMNSNFGDLELKDSCKCGKCCDT